MTTFQDPAPAPIAEEPDKAWRSRMAFRSDLWLEIESALIAAEADVKGGEMDGVSVVTHRAWRDALSEIMHRPLPPVDNRSAEVLTDAIITVWAACPRCHIAGPITVVIGPELRVDNAGAELHLKAKSTPRTHVCGQLNVPAPDPESDGQTTIADLIGEPCAYLMSRDGIDGEAVFCVLPQGHEGDHSTLADFAESVIEGMVDEAASGAMDADGITYTTETGPDGRPVITAHIEDDDLLPGEMNLGACPYPGCDLAAEHPGAHQRLRS